MDMPTFAEQDFSLHKSPMGKDELQSTEVARCHVRRLMDKIVVSYTSAGGSLAQISIMVPIDQLVALLKKEGCIGE